MLGREGPSRGPWPRRSSTRERPLLSVDALLDAAAYKLAELVYARVGHRIGNEATVSFSSHQTLPEKSGKVTRDVGLTRTHRLRKL